MRAMVENFVRTCAICQQVKYSTRHPAGLLHPLPIPDRIWEDVSMDFVTSLPKSQGFTVILVVVDRLSKYCHLGALDTHYTATKVASLFLHMVIKLHGFPRSIVTDRDAIFMSRFWKDLFSFSGTKLLTTSAYHPQSDGQTEVLNRTLQQYLRCYTMGCPQKWVSYLPWAEYAYNTSYHEGAGTTPFQVVYGRVPPTIASYMRGASKLDAIDQELLTRDELLSTLKANLVKAQARMKFYADQNRTDMVLQQGDLVYVKLQPHRQISVSLAKTHKLSKRFYGPFEVLKRIGSCAYQLKLPEYSKIHDVFHVSLLKPARGTQNSSLQLPPEAINNQPLVQPLVILNTRTILRNQQPIKQVLVQWRGLLPEDTSWEDWTNFSQLYPDFNLEDKVFFPERETSVTNIRQRKQPAWMREYIP